MEAKANYSQPTRLTQRRTHWWENSRRQQHGQSTRKLDFKHTRRRRRISRAILKLHRNDLLVFPWNHCFVWSGWRCHVHHRVVADTPHHVVYSVYIHNPSTFVCMLCTTYICPENEVKIRLFKANNFFGIHSSDPHISSLAWYILHIHSDINKSTRVLDIHYIYGKDLRFWARWFHWWILLEILWTCKGLGLWI